MYVVYYFYAFVRQISMFISASVRGTHEARHNRHLLRQHLVFVFSKAELADEERKKIAS